MKTRSALIVVIVLGLAVRAQADYVYNAHSEFNSTSNTASDTWQYMTAATFGTNGGYTLMPSTLYGATEISTVQGWGIDDAWTAPYLADWTVSGEPDIKPAGLYFDLELAGGAATTPSGVLAWRSPTSGYATVDFTLTGGPTAVANATGTGDGMTYALFAGSEATARATGVATGAAAATEHVAYIPVSAGTMLYLQFGSGANSYGDDYRCDYTIAVSDVPEPSSIVLLGSTLVGLLAYAWRKRK